MVKDKIWGYLRHRVAVKAMGIQYTGIFKGADEEFVFLQCETTWVQIPWLEITSFQLIEELKPEALQKEVQSGPAEQESRLKVIKGGKESEKPGTGLTSKNDSKTKGG